MAGGNVVVVENKDAWDKYHTESKDRKKTILVDFTAAWCGPCRMIGPYFDELSTRHPSMLFLKVDVDALEDVAGICGISAMPTFQVWKDAFAFIRLHDVWQDGEKVDELVGASKDKLKDLINRYTNDSTE